MNRINNLFDCSSINGPIEIKSADASMCVVLRWFSAGGSCYTGDCYSSVVSLNALSYVFCIGYDGALDRSATIFEVLYRSLDECLSDYR